MLKRLKSYAGYLSRKLEHIERGVREIEWGQRFHDATRGSDSVARLPLNVGGWAASYSFLYVLYRVCIELEDEGVLELGLGESTKLIHAVRSDRGYGGPHRVIEHDPQWKDTFNRRWPELPDDHLVLLDLATESVDGHSTRCYSGLMDVVDVDSFTVFVVDGPLGTPRHSRHDIVRLARAFPPEKEFIILMDDVNRPGDRETADLLLQVLDPSRAVHTGEYGGRRDQLIVCSDQYRHLSSV